MDELFEMERERPFAVGEEVVVDTVLGERTAKIVSLGRSRDGFPIAVVDTGGRFTVSLSRLRHQEVS